MARAATSGAGSASPDLMVDLARRAAEAFNQRDVEGLAALLHEDCEFHSAFGAIEGRVYHGPAQTADYVADIDAMFDGWRLVNEEFHPGRDGRIVSTYRAVGRARESGIPIDYALALLWQVHDGKLLRGEVHLDQAEALRRAGLEERARDWERTPRSGSRFES